MYLFCQYIYDCFLLMTTWYLRLTWNNSVCQLSVYEYIAGLNHNIKWFLYGSFILTFKQIQQNRAPLLDCSISIDCAVCVIWNNSTIGTQHKHMRHLDGWNGRIEMNLFEKHTCKKLAWCMHQYVWLLNINPLRMYCFVWNRNICYLKNRPATLSNFWSRLSKQYQSSNCFPYRMSCRYITLVLNAFIYKSSFVLMHILCIQITTVIRCTNSFYKIYHMLHNVTITHTMIGSR